MATLAVIGAVGLPLAFQPHLQELDLRVRTHTGALTRFYLDALLGLTALRAHGAERAVRREQENLLVEWSDASLRWVRSNLALEGLQATAGFGLAMLLLLFYAEGGNDPGGALLLAYWALNIPILGEEVALLVRQYPIHRNLTLRLLEPLGAPAEVQADHAHAALTTGAPGDRRRPDEDPAPDPASSSVPAPGVTIRMESVTVYAAGHPILQDIDLTVDAGRHIAIVGASGAGKSSLLGLLLGWHRAAHGRVLIDDQPLDTARLDLLRQATVWIDPSVQIWNRALLANLSYGSDRADPLALSWALAAAELFDTVERLPEGLQTRLGEGGGLVSGGEGQRVRIARGLCKPAPRLVILDEPFRGLGRTQRRDLLDRIRERWQNATLLCITHDVGETLGFERVLVVDLGRIVEDAHPEILREDPASRYRTLLDADRGVRIDLRANTRWRRLHLDGGKLHETHGPG
ncbi:MAG: ATP-binding cassette domain-containing protein [Gammaproteobacteria bacterium]